MTSKQTLRLSLVVVAIVMVLAIAFAAFTTLTPATARADGSPISDVLTAYEYGNTAAAILGSIQDGDLLWWGAADPSSVIDGGYSGTITATLYDGIDGAPLYTASDYDYIVVGNYAVKIEWTADGDFEAGSEWVEIEITQYALTVNLDITFQENFRYGNALSYVDPTNYLSDTYLQGGSLTKAVYEDDVTVNLYFVDGEGNAFRPENAGDYTVRATMTGDDSFNYTMKYEYYDDGLGDYVAEYSTDYIDMPVTMLPKLIPVSFDLVYHYTDGSVYKTIENLIDFQTGIAYIGADFDIQATTSYTEKIDEVDTMVVKPVITGQWYNMMAGQSVDAPNLPGDYTLSASAIGIEAVEDGYLAGNYAVEMMMDFTFRVEKREVWFNQFVSEAPYRGGDETLPPYNTQPVSTTFESDNSIYTSSLPIDDLVWDLVMDYNFDLQSFDVGDSNTVHFNFSMADFDLYEFSGSSDSRDVAFTVVKAEPILGYNGVGAQQKEDVLWYSYENQGDNYTNFVLSKVDFDIRSYNDLVNLQLDPDTWYYYNGDTWLNAALPINTPAGTFQLRVSTKATSEYNAKILYFNVEISKAPIYAVWQSDSTAFEQGSYSVGPTIEGFKFFVFDENVAANEGYLLAPDRFDPYDYGEAYYAAAYLTGETSSLYAGNYVATLEISTNNDIDDYFYIANPEFNWSVNYRYLTFEKFDLEHEFVYGGDDGKSYYTLPTIDYRKSSKTYDFGNEVWVDPEEVSPVTGEIMGFGSAAEQYKYPYEEIWKFRLLGETPGEWTVWTNEVYPVSVGSYDISYEATFCYGGFKWIEEPEGSGNWIEVIDPEKWDPSKGLFKVEGYMSGLLIQPKEVAIEWSNLTNVYDGSVHDAVVSADLCYGETVFGVIDYAKGYSNAGEYTLTATAPQGNYTLTNNTATLTINKATLTVTVQDEPAVIYGDAVPTYTAVITGWQENDEDTLGAAMLAAIDWSDSQYAQYSDVGEYAIIAKGLTADNYSFTYVPATLTVSAKVVDVVWTDPDYTYNGSAREYQIATATGVQGEDIALTVSVEGIVKDAKTYALTAAETDDSDNYVLANTAYNMTIAPKALTVAPNSLQSKVFGDADVVLTFDVGGGIGISGEEPVFAGELSRDAGETVGAYTITLGSLTVNSNYVIDTFIDNIVFSISARTITVVPTGNQGKTFGEDDPVLTYDYTNKVPFETEENKPVFTGALSRVAGEENGKYLIQQGTLALSSAAINSNYVLAFDSSVQFEIGKAAVDMSGVTFANVTVTYDGQTHSIVVANLPAAITGVSYTYNGVSAVGVTNAGTFTIVASFTPDGDHRAPADMTATLTIEKRTLTVTPNAEQSKIYGEADPVYTYTVSNAVEGETPVFVGALVRAEGKNVGNYAITTGTLALSNGANVNNNYEWQFAEAVVNFAITKRPVTLQLEAQTFTYGDDIQLVAPVIGGMGLAYDEQWTDVAQINFNLNSQSNIGTYWISIASLANNNYNDTIGGANYTIEKAQLTNVSAAQTGTLTYNGQEQTAQVATTATAVNDLAVKFFYSATAGSNFTDEDVPAFVTAGEHTVYYEAYEYNHERKAGSFVVTIGKATYDMSAVSFENKTVDYNGTEQVVEISGNLPAGVVVSYANNTRRNNGSQIATASFDGDYDNYFAIDNMTATLTVNKITVTLKPDVKSKFYGDEDPALTYTWSGNIVETPVIYGQLRRAVGENEGVYSIIVSDIGLTNAEVNNNYLLALDDTVKFYLNRKSVTLNLYVDDVLVTEATNVTYDGQAHTFVVKADGVKGEVITISEETAVNVFGSTDFVVDAQDLHADGFERDNYVLDAAYNVPDFAIVAKAITITADDKTSVYGDEFEALTATITDAEGAYVLPDAAEDVYALTKAQGIDVAEYVITVNLLGNPNYNVTAVNGTYTITARPITITIEAKTSIFGDTLVALTAEDSAIVNGDADVYSLSSTVTATSAVGKYAITGTALDANYDITFVGEADAYTLTQRELTLTWGAAEFIYNAAEQVPTATIGNTVTGQAVAVSVAGAKKDAGEYTATASINNTNYKLPAVNTKAFVIAKKALTITAEDKSIDYGDYAPEQSFYSVAYEGFAGEETNAVLGGSLAYACSYEQYAKAGTYTIVPGGLTSDNYDITFVNGTLTVKAGDFEEVKVDNGKVSVDVDDKAAAGEGVTINKIIESAAKAGDNAGVTLTVGEGAAQTTIVLDAAAIQSLKDKDVKLTYSTKTGADANGSALMLEISLGAEFNGSATLTVPFVNEAPTGKVAKVFYVDADGKKVDMQGTFENDTVTFSTTHFSTYVVEYVLSTATIVGIIVACVAVVAIVAVVVIIMMKKKKGAAPKKEEAAE